MSYLKILQMPIIAPSILSADFLNLGRDIEMVNNSEADWFHLDVMDGRYVPNISYGMSIISQMKKAARKTFDVHLMILEPEKYFEDFKKAGTDILTIHYEASTHLHRSVQAIKALVMKAGVALNPHTPVQLLEYILPELDLVLIMSVNPGFGGQKFIPQALDKIRTLRKMIDAGRYNTIIEIDGGVTLENAPERVAAGTDALALRHAAQFSRTPEAIWSGTGATSWSLARSGSQAS